ncbi:MAG: 4-oxalmesaconate hydratase [Chloroflexota bacterium]|nr:4-oxalmesaconate hydratase [Chloroflexota bacterium]
MIVDVHGHFTTAPAAFEAYRARLLADPGAALHGQLGISEDELAASLEPVIRQMDDRGIDVLFFSPRAAGMGHDQGGEPVSRHWTEVSNDLIARACGLHPGRLIPVCQLPQSPGVAVDRLHAELERCAAMGFVGCLVNPDVSGGLAPLTPSLGDRWWYPLWEKLVELRMPAMVHASATRNPHMHLNGSHYIAQDHAAVVELCMSPVFDDVPGLTIVVPHGGGGIPFQFNRQRALHRLQDRRSFEEAVRLLYFDTAVYDADSLEMLIRKIGPANVLFGSEMFGTAKAVDPETGRTFDDILPLLRAVPGLSDDDRDLILEGNALRLYPRAAAFLAERARTRAPA